MRRALLPLALFALPAPALAAPEEVQVYMDELGAKGEVGLDLHLNHVAEGSFTPDYPGQQSGLHRWRLTPEFSLGLGHGFEAGLYLPLATLPLPELLRRIEDLPAEMAAHTERLRCTAVRYLNVATRVPPKADYHWLYVPEERYPFYRVGIYTNAVPEMAPTVCPWSPSHSPKA